MSFLVTTMDKISIISMFVTFVTSNEVLQFEPQNSIGQKFSQGDLGVTWNPPKFCNGLDCPAYSVVNKTDVSIYF